MAGLLDILGQNKNTSLSPAGGYTSAGGSISGAPVSGGGTGRNPFSSMFASDAGGLPGFIGMLSGSGTRAEMEMERMGAGQAQGLAGLQRRIKDGMSPQQAVVDFVGSDEGMQFFGTSQDPIGAIKGYLQLSQKPADELTTVGPDQTVFNKTTGEFGARTPSAEANAINDMAAAADYTPAQSRQVFDTLLQLKTAGPNGTEQERGLKKLVDGKLISPDMAAKISAGIITVKPTTDPLTGQPNGGILVDTSKYLQTQNPEDIETVILGANNGGLQGDGGPDTSELKIPKVPGDIIFGAGAGGAIGAAAGGVGGMVSPELSAPVLNKSRSQLKNILAAATSVMSSNTRLAAGLQIFRDSVDKTGLSSNPGEQAQALMALREFIDQEMAVAGMALNDPSSGRELKNQAQKDLQDLRRVVVHLPSVDDLQASYEKYEAGEGTLPDLIKQGAGKVKSAVEGFGKTKDAVEEAVTGTEKPARAVSPTSGQNAPRSFKTEQEAAAAAKAGTLKAGDRITIGGVSGTWAD